MGKITKEQARRRRHARVRAKVAGTAERPRLAVYRSNSATYVQVIDDEAGTTLFAADTRTITEGDKSAAARAVGRAIGAKAKAAGIEHVVFDRGGYLYHGRVKALAEGAREGGLSF